MGPRRGFANRRPRRDDGRRRIKLAFVAAAVASMMAGGTRSASAASAQSDSGWYVATAVGDGSAGNAVAATSASFNFPSQVAVDAQGNVLIADTYDDTERVLAATSGNFYGRPMTAGDIYTLAGTGLTGYTDGIPATHSGTYNPDGVALDRHGNVLVADTANDLVRVIATRSGTFYGTPMLAGDIYAIAGDGKAGHSGDGGKASSAELDLPAQLAVDAHGNVLIADSRNDRVRVLAETTGTFYGRPMTAGDIYTIAGDGKAGDSGNGGKAVAAELNDPLSAVVDKSGNLVISDAGNDRVRVVAGSNGTFYGRAMKKGDIYAVAGNGKAGHSGDGGKAIASELDNEYGGASLDGSGNIVINDSNNGRVRVVAGATGNYYGKAMTAGDIYSVAGDGTLGDAGDRGPATSAELGYTDSAAVDSKGNLVIDDGDDIRVVAVTSGNFYGQVMTAGDIYTIAGDDTESFGGDGGLASSSEISAPSGITSDSAGDIFFDDTDNLRVRMVPNHRGRFFGQSMTAGDIFTVAGNGALGDSGEGGPASSAEFKKVAGVALDAHHNLIVTDEGASRVLVVANTSGTYYGRHMAAGYIYSIAGSGMVGYSGIGGPARSATIGCPLGAVVDRHGNVVITDACNQRILVVADSTGTFYGRAMTAGYIYSIAGEGTIGYSGIGGPARSARIGCPLGTVVDRHGNVIFTAACNQRILVVAGSTGTFYGREMTAGYIYSIAGSGRAGYSGNGGLATRAELNNPDDVVVDEAGNLVFTDAHNDVVRVVAASAGTYYGQTMKPDHIYLLAGNGTYGWEGDGGSPAVAEFANPAGLAAVTIGDGGTGSAIYITDLANARIRVVDWDGGGA